jgi:hypothetical protein
VLEVDGDSLGATMDADHPTLRARALDVADACVNDNIIGG